MKVIDNRQSKLHQFACLSPVRQGFKRIKDKSIQIKRNKRGQHLIDRRGNGKM